VIGTATVAVTDMATAEIEETDMVTVAATDMAEETDTGIEVEEIVDMAGGVQIIEEREDVPQGEDHLQMPTAKHASTFGICLGEPTGRS
jgi:hypothetical protein